MFDFSGEILAFHNDEVTLSQGERTTICKKRDINRERIKRGLNCYDYPLPYNFISQGSYAMRTIIQHPDNDYDIDDGVYFDKEQLIGPRGGEMSSLEARKMVWWAIHSDTFKTPPEYIKNCVRVYYNEGYCVDVPVYRRIIEVDENGEEQEYFELASSIWKRSDARDVTKWFDNECKQKSPDEKNGRQLRRICRLVKKFARSRESWKGDIASGFVITKLVTECYQPANSRDDISFYMTMVRIYQRLSLDLIVNHPIMLNETITKNTDDPKLRFLRDKILDITKRVDVLFSTNCTYKKAAQKWNLIFHTDYF